MTALTTREQRALEAIAERIFPTTDTPGAIEAGAVTYIDRALAGPYQHLLSRYRRGLRQLNQHSQAEFGQDFAELSEATQDALLIALEAGQIDLVIEGDDFFRTLRRHVLEGIFGEPQYGGNRDLVGWQLVGFPGQRHGYPDGFINRVVELTPIADDPVPEQERP
jgi:hypothetical protein